MRPTIDQRTAHDLTRPRFDLHSALNPVIDSGRRSGHCDAIAFDLFLGFDTGHVRR